MAGLSHGYDSKCLLPNQKHCYIDTYKKQINPYVSIIATKSFGLIKITLIDSIFYRSITIGINGIY
jgi:hypothetical protein